MSICGGQPDEISASEDISIPIRERHQPKTTKKLIRVLTVIAYLLSVSLAAILLSVYYVYVWKSPELSSDDNTEINRSAHLPFHSEFNANYEYIDVSNVTGRSNNTVNGRGDNDTAAAEKLLQVENNSTSDLDFDLSADYNETSLAYTESSNTSGHNNIT